MSALRNHTITSAKTTRLRVGIKWDPLERDDIADAYAIESEAEARAELSAVSQYIKSSVLIAQILRVTFVLSGFASRIERTLDQSREKKKAMEKYLSQVKMLSHDLDLCCCCFDQDGKMIKFITPVSTEKKEELQLNPAFMHSGDALTGTSGLFDEELLVNLTAIDPAIQHVFFIIISINHGFNQIKGGFWSIISTKDEKELMSAPLQTHEPHRIYAMAKLSRNGEAWSLQEIGDFCPVEGKGEGKGPLQQRVGQMLVSRYMAKADVTTCS